MSNDIPRIMNLIPLDDSQEVKGLNGFKFFDEKKRLKTSSRVETLLIFVTRWNV